jgi:hypothetical protein
VCLLTIDANQCRPARVAQFHVVSNPALARTGGHLFDDNVGLFTQCGKDAEECGRVVRQPALATDPAIRKALWKKSRSLVKDYNTPLGEPWEKPPEKPKKIKKLEQEAAQDEGDGDENEENDDNDNGDNGDEEEGQEGEREDDEEEVERLVEEDWGEAAGTDDDMDEEQFFHDDDGEL